jgi:integrase
LPELGEIQLRKLTPLRIQTFYNNKLKDKQSSSSVHSMHKVLHGGLKQAVKLRYLSNNPADGASLPADEPQREGQSLTLEQAQHLLTVVRGHRLEAFIALTLTTGMRHGELTALRWSAIKFGTGTEIGSISVQRTAGFIAKHGFVENEPKTKKSERVLPLIPAVARVLEIHRCNQEEIKRKAGLRWEEHELVFTTKTGNYVHSNITRDAFYRLLKKANTIPDVSGNMLNLPPVHIHDLRHTASTLWQSLGISEKVAQSWLGHTSLEMTRNVYTHLLPSMQREAAERINALFQAIPEE